MKQLSIFLFIVLASLNLFAEVPAVDAVYKSTIKTVQLYPKSSTPVTPPILSLNSTDELILEFDELSDEASSYYYKIIHCNADWAVSNLRSIQYVKDFNELFIQNRQFSTSTRVVFTHYSAILPQLLVSGNFFVKVYEDSNEEHPILTRRFNVIESHININGQVSFPSNTSKRFTHQMLNFQIAYPQYNVVNPSVQMKVIVRQNYVWNSATPLLNPLYIREDLKELDYTFYNDETTFPGGNEYRYFDMRSFRFSGFNVGRIIKNTDNTTDVLLAIDHTRASKMYILWQDINGKYTIENYETGGTRLEADYAKVRFTLEAENVSGADVYVYGELSNWELSPNNRMTYNEDRKAYEVELYLKQGIYNYRYYVKGKKSPIDENYFEGSYNATENQYDVLVYYRVPGEFYDRIIGYQSFRYQGTR
jgi:hypothetical protein